MSYLPFQGVRILDLSTVWAVPYGVELMSALGAEVIKVEYQARPGFRIWGPFADGEAGDRFWERCGTFNFLHRNKLGVTLNLKSEEGIALFRELVQISDIVVENYTPRVMKQLGLDYESLTSIRPDLIMLSFTGYGHTGPWRHYSAIGDSMEATSGFTEVTGYAGGPPMKVGYAYVDLIASWYCALALTAALQRRDTIGIGQWFDFSMYECGVSFLGDAVLAYSATNAQPARIGNDHPWTAPHGCFRCLGEDRWITISVTNDEQWKALCGAMGNLGLTDDPRYADGLQRSENRAELEVLLESWTSQHEDREVMEVLQASGVPASIVFNSSDLLTNSHLAQRRYYEVIKHPERTRLGSRIYPRIPFTFNSKPTGPSKPPPGIGEHNSHVFSNLLGHDEATLGSLYRSGVLGNEPIGVEEKFSAMSLQALADSGRFARIDIDYQEKLKEVHTELEGEMTTGQPSEPCA